MDSAGTDNGTIQNTSAPVCASGSAGTFQADCFSGGTPSSAFSYSWQTGGNSFAQLATPLTAYQGVALWVEIYNSQEGGSLLDNQAAVGSVIGLSSVIGSGNPCGPGESVYVANGNGFAQSLCSSSSGANSMSPGSNGNWYHIVLNFPNPSDLDFYLNGQLIASYAYTGPVPSIMNIANMGVRDYRLDEVVFNSEPFTASQIAALYNGGMGSEAQPAPPTCNVPSVVVGSTNSNGVIGAVAATVTGQPCTWTFTVTNKGSYLWLDIQETTTGSATVVPADPTSALYAQLGVLAPGKSVAYTVHFSQPGQDVNVFANLTGKALDTAMNINIVQALIDGLSLGRGVGTVELTIEDVGEIMQAAAQMPNLEAALADFFHVTCFGPFCIILPEFVAGYEQLVAFAQSQAQKNTLASLLASLDVDLTQSAITSFLGLPGGLTGIFLEIVSNVDTAFFGNTAGSVSLTAQ